MDRRKFIKTSICAGCVAALSGCSLFNQKKNEMRPEYRFKLKNVEQVSKRIRLEACNDCQLNCYECWMRKIDPEKINKVGGFGYLKFKDFKDFIDKNSFVNEIELSNNGEIFLNPELNDIIKYAYEKGIKLTAHNGVNLNTVSDETLENLVKYNFEVITVSMDAATPEVYLKYRRGGDFNTVIDNIKKINKFKAQYNKDHPYLNYQFIVFGHNEHEIDAAKKLAKELDMEIYFVKNLAEGFSPIKDVKTVEEKTGLKYPEYRDNLKEDENGDKVSSAISKYRVPETAEVAGTVDAPEMTENNETTNREEINPDDIFCYQFNHSPQINFNGDFLGCCTLVTENFGVNVFEVGLLEAMNSDKILRAKLMLSDFSVEPMEDIPCTRCGIYYDLLKGNNHPLTFPESETD